MSIWTHVNGNIRLDEFDYRNVEIIKFILGKMNTYDPGLSGLPIEDFSNNDKDILLPCGSEGSLKYNVLSNKDLNSLEAHSISIWGDLRDYDDKDVIEKLIPWFSNLLNCFIKNRLFIRNACLEVEIEYRLHLVLVADCDNINVEDKTIPIKVVAIDKADN